MKTKRFLCLVLTLVLMLSLGMVTAQAATNDPAPTTDFTKGGLSKILWVADGVALTGITGVTVDGTPVTQVKTYTFSFTKNTGITYDSPSALATDGPEIADQTITVDGDTASRSQHRADIATGYKTFADIFGATPSPAGFTHAGEYVYTVRETNAPFGVVVGEAPNIVTKTLTVGGEAYNVHVFVSNDDSATNTDTNKLAYAAVTVWTATYNETTSVWEDDHKIDPTIIEKTIEYGGSDKFSASNEFVFNNKYTEVINNETANTGVLKVTKTITGDYADRTKSFPVSVEIHIPSTALATATNDVVAVGKANGSATSTAAATITPALSSTVQDYVITFGSGTTAGLADGGMILFTRLPAGTTFTVKETQTTPYKSKVTGFVKTPDTEYQPGDVSKEGGGFILEDEKAVAIENNLDIPPVTGIIIENLPYVLLAAVGVLGITFLVLKRKKRKAE